MEAEVIARETPGHPGALGVAAILLLAYMLAFAGRQLPAALAAPITSEFQVSDAALGAIHGYGFALLYATMALPVGWLVDNHARLRLLGCCLLLWSGATVVCGLARSLEMLIAGRLIVGLGQAIVTPVAYSLLGDLWPRSRTGLAVAAFAVGPFLGLGLMFILGGHLAEIAGWRVPFIVTGLLGIALAFFVFGYPEPARRRRLNGKAPSLTELLSYVRRHGLAIFAVDAAMLFTAMAGHAVLGWGVVWLSRVHDFALGEATLAMGVAVLVGGVVGTVTGGVLGDRLLRSSARWSRLSLLALAAATAAPIALAAFAAEQPGLAFVGLTILIALIAIALAAGPAALQDITPPSMRGLQHGLAVFIINMFGFGLGPLVVGLVSDGRGGPSDRFGQVLTLTVPLMLLAAAITATLGAKSHARSAAGLA